METVNRTFESIALKLKSGSNFYNPEATRTSVLKTLEGLSVPILMIFDNYDKPTEFPNIRDYFPPHAKIIINSRHTDAKNLGKEQPVNAMTAEEGVELLLVSSGYERTEEAMKEARQIVKTLGGLALAIDQAARYIGGQRISLNSFAEIFAKQKSAILKYTPTYWEYSESRLAERDGPLSVFTTWEMSLDQLQVNHGECNSLVHLLTLGAFIDTRKISEGLFSLYAQQASRPEWLEYFMDGGKWNSKRYQDSVLRLRSISLLTNFNRIHFSFHPLVAEWLKLRFDGKARDQYVEEAIHVVRLFIDNGDKKEMSIDDKEAILSHLDTVIAGDELLHTNGHQVSKSLQDAMVSFGSFYRRLGRYQETKHLIERAMQCDNEVAPNIRNVLANMYCDQGNLIEAEIIYLQILIKLKEQPPTKDSDEKLHSTRLGIFYWTQDDKLNASGTKLEGVHTGNLSAFDPWYVSALSAKNCLAIAYMKEGRLSTAEALFKQALEGREKASGFEHSKTLEVVNHLGALEVLKGDFNAAERLFLRALEGITKQYGVDHTKTHMIYCNLGLCYLEFAHYSKAEWYFRLAARNYQDAVGPAYSFTLTKFYNQGLLLLQQHKYSAAEAKFKRAIEGWRASGGGVAKSEADSNYCLATIYETQEDKRVEAETLFREAQTLYERALGKEHPQTVEAKMRADQVRNSIEIASMEIV